MDLKVYKIAGNVLFCDKAQEATARFYVNEFRVKISDGGQGPAQFYETGIHKRKKAPN